ncbi:MAG: hypothetical protein V4608_07450 [Bacteroidota bacterium]
MNKNDIMNCPLTEKVVNFNRGSDTTYYSIKVGEKEFEIFLCNSCLRNIQINSGTQHIFLSLMANGHWPVRSFIKGPDCSTTHHVADSESIYPNNYLESALYPKIPKEKMDNFFLYLFNLQKIDGELIEIDFGKETVWQKNYFKSVEECLYYLTGLKENDLIHYWHIEKNRYRYRVTHLGLNKAVQLQSDGNNSNQCFIAMAFSDEMKPYREAIKRSLSVTKFKHIIIDEEHLSSDKTIPDGILAGIKAAKFCVADFTHHRNGVYFESGYALGLGKPVIYLCRKDEFDKAHFDIKQLQHIIYNTPEELEKMLTAKIEAWIK